MKPSFFPLFIFFIVTIAFPIFIFRVPTVKAQPQGEWLNRYTYDLDFGNQTHTTTSFTNPQVFWNGSFQELEFVENPGFASVDDCRYFVRNSHIALEICDNYVKEWNPDYTNISVYSEQWTVEYFKGNSWKDTGLGFQIPSWSVSQNDDSVNITRIQSLIGIGELNVTYIVRKGAFLKHNVIFKNDNSKTYEYRALMSLNGITNTKVKCHDEDFTVTTEKHKVTPFFKVGESQTTLVYSEFLWSLGTINVETDTWMSDTLRDIVFNTHANGIKADVIIGNYTLNPTETFEIDPTTSTFQVGADLNDSHVRNDVTNQNNLNYITIGESGTNYYDGGHMFTSVTVPNSATISSSYLILNRYGREGSACLTDLYGHDVADSFDFSDTNTLIPARARTTATVGWDDPLAGSTGWNTSPDIGTLVKEIIDIGGWSSGNNMSILQIADHASTQYQSSESYDFSSVNAAKLEVTYTVGAQYIADLSQSITSSWSVLIKWDAISDLSQSITSSWTVLTQWNANTDFSQSLTTSWNVLVQSDFSIIPTLTLTSSWTVDIIHSIVTHHIADLSQSFVTSWNILIQSAFSINPNVAITSSWIVDIIKGLQRSVDLTLNVTTSWTIDIIHVSLTLQDVLGLAAIGFILAVVALALVVTKKD